MPIESIDLREALTHQNPCWFQWAYSKATYYDKQQDFGQWRFVTLILWSWDSPLCLLDGTELINPLGPFQLCSAEMLMIYRGYLSKLYKCYSRCWTSPPNEFSSTGGSFRDQTKIQCGFNPFPWWNWCYQPSGPEISPVRRIQGVLVCK